jgi:hypothetical protein
VVVACLRAARAPTRTAFAPAAGCQALCARATRFFFVCRAHEFSLLATACRAPTPSNRLLAVRAVEVPLSCALASAVDSAIELSNSPTLQLAPAARVELLCCAHEFSLLAGAWYRVVLFLCARSPVHCRDCRRIIGVAQLPNRILVGHRFHIRHGPHVSCPYPNLPARRLIVVFLVFPRRPTSRLNSSVVLVAVPYYAY